MRGPTIAVAVAAGVSALLGTLLIGTVPAPAVTTPATTGPAPTLSLGSTSLVPGQSVAISGANWPRHELFQATLCGGDALLGSADCANGAAVAFAPADVGGVIQATLPVTDPPTPCPCVVQITRVHPPEVVDTVPVTVVGMPSETPVTPPALRPPSLRVSGVHVVSVSSWAAWFGAAAPRELVLTVHNAGAEPIRPLLAAHWIEGGVSHVIATPRARVIPVGGTARLTATFHLSTLSWGTMRVVGQVVGTTFAVNLRTETSTYPWGLLVVGIVIVAGLLALIVLAVVRRRRRKRRDGGAPPAEGLPPEPVDDEPTVRLITSSTGAPE